MALENENAGLEKALVFFQKAEKIAYTNNFDYAIDLYMEGLRCAPEAVAQGHVKLYELASRRSAKGGGKPSIIDTIKYQGGKTPLEKMLNAEYLFAKSPQSLGYAQKILAAATEGGYSKTALWIADLMFGLNNDSKKPSAAVYIQLKDCYFEMKQFERSLAACKRAAQLKPKDPELIDELQRLSAEATVSRGKYDQEGDFRKAIKNRKKQEEFQAQLGTVKSDDYRTTALEAAINAFKENPDQPKNIYGLANTLAEMDSDQGDADAIKVLEHAYQKTKDFSYRQKAGEVRGKQLRRQIRRITESLDSNPESQSLKSQLEQANTRLYEFELDFYQQCVNNYPTDTGMKFEYACRLFKVNMFDEAIPLFQDCQRDPRNRVASMNKIGLCFFMKGWYTDAIDVFNSVIESRETKDDGIAKEIRYNLARAYEEQGNKTQALDIYRKLAQQDFSYRDVRRRVDVLRKELNEPTSQ